MNIIRCKEAELDELYSGSALTFEGTCIDEGNLEWLINWFKEHDCTMKSQDFYVISGKLMNSTYKLTGDNQYPDDLNILCIKLSDLTNITKLACARFELGGRWFDDVVDNNASRESK